jgi:uncharacterized protein
MKEVTDELGRTTLHEAALRDNAAEVRMLLARGANVDAQDRDGFTPLHFAAQQGSLAAAEALLHAGATVDVENRFGNTPLWVAVFSSRGEGDFIALLRSHGADPHHANKQRRTPVQMARLIANYDVARYFGDVSEDLP